MSHPHYYRPIVQSDPVRSVGAMPLAGGRYWFDRAEVLVRGRSLGLVAARDIPDPILERLTRARADIAGLSLDRPRLMAVLNVTPDSFSDGGDNADPGTAISAARAMIAEGADLLDIGGESTRPGAETIAADDELGRIMPVLTALGQGDRPVISVDTRKAGVARRAVEAGAAIINDVSALNFDPAMASAVADAGVPVCLMHAQGDPKTMQQNPAYEDVLLDVFDYLSGRIEAAVAAGVNRAAIMVDPGIGFGKTLVHNLRLLNNISLFHGLGCPILLGVSRKRFIGTIGDAPEPKDRMPGSVAVALAAMAQGVQIIRVHDTAQTRQAAALFNAVTGQV